jgi:hypothetical protein
MDRTKLKSLLQFTFDHFRKLLSELRAYEIAFAALKATLEQEHPGFSALASGSLVAARQSPALREMIRKQCDEPLEKFLQQVSQAETEEEVEKLLLTMPTNKFVN